MNSNDNDNSNFVPVAAILLAVVLWGSSFAAMKFVVRDLSPVSVMWVRMATAFLLVLPFAKKLWPRNYQKGDLKYLAGLVLLMPCLYFLLESNALTLTSSSQAGVISSSVPLLAGVGAWFVLKESLRPATIIGLLVSVAGVAWLTASGDPDSHAPNPVLGNMMELLAMVSAAGFMIILKKLTPRYSPWTLTALQTVAGVIFFSPGAVPVLSGGFLEWTSIQTVCLLYLGSFVTLGAFGMYNWGMSKIPTAQASAFINLVPVVAVIFGWFIMSETLNSSQLTASVFVLAGVLASQMPGPKRARAKQ